MKPPAKYKPDWYRAKYGIAAVYANAAAQERAAAAGVSGVEQERARSRASGRSTSAREHAQALAITCCRTILELQRSPFKDLRTWWRRTRSLSRPERRRLLEFLQDTMEPPALVLFAGMLGPPQSREVPVHQTLSLPTEHDAEQHEALLQVLESHDPDPRVLVSHVEQMSRKDPRANYNLACLYTSWGDTTSAVDRLRRSLSAMAEDQRARMIDRALEKDPTLSPIWQTEAGKELKADLNAQRQRLGASIGFTKAERASA